jgi:hypothetical protein
MELSSKTIQKELTSNDAGSTGAHQDGICVPKDPEILSFFPKLDSTIKNPRSVMHFSDGLKIWVFSFIYYNGKKFGGTRNEYRLTGMMPYFKANSLDAGDTIKLTRDVDGTYYISYVRRPMTPGDDVIIIKSTSWKSVKF